MERKRSLGKWVALGCGGLIGLVVVLGLAGYGILRAVGGARSQGALARLRASGAPTTWAEAIPPPVPDERNAAVVYEKAFEFMAPMGDWAPKVGKYLWATTPAERRALEGGLRQVLRDNAEALSCAQEAAKRPACRFDRDWHDPLALAMPELSRLEQLAIRASIRALFLADRGETRGALEAWSLNVSMVRHLESHPILKAQWTRYSVLNVGARSLRGVLAQSSLSSDECRRMDQEFAALDLDGPFVRAVQVEGVKRLRMLRRARDDPRFFDRLRSGSVWSPASKASSVRWPDPRWFGYGAISLFDQAATIECWQEHIALAGRPYREGVGQSGPAYSIPAYAPLAQRVVLFSTLPGNMMARDLAKAKIALMRTALGLAAYRTEYGKYPESLDELRHALKWEVVSDPFSGGDLAYRREGTGYLLYSIGPDLDDDGGKPLSSSRPHPRVDGDDLWRVTR